MRVRKCSTIAAVGLVFLMVASLSARAQTKAIVEQWLSTMAGTLNIVAAPYMSEGQLTGCSLIFGAIQQDWTYRQEAYIKVSGNVSLMIVKGKLASTLKVTVVEIDPSMPSLGLNPSPPSRAYLVAPNFGTNLASLVARYPSDTPGALFSVFQLSPTFEMVLDGLKNNRLTIAFNRNDGVSDIQLPLEMDFVEVDNSGNRVRSERMKLEFIECARALGSSVLPNE
jgi:hypothetical protein